MIIYSITIKIDLSAHDEWLAWMKEEHINEIINTGFFVDFKFHKILSQDERDGMTYNIQFKAKNIGDYFEYRDNYAPIFQEKANNKFKDKFVSFRTLLKEVN